MNKKTLLILGGYGGVGRSLCRLLLKETYVSLIVAGRRKAKAEEFAGILNKEYEGNRVSARYADASDLGSMRDAFQSIDLVAVTATTPTYLRQIAETALTAECDYLDILVRQDHTPAMLALSDKATQEERIIITQAGFHPGLPAPFIRYATQYFDDYQKAIVGIAMNARVEKPKSTYEIVHEVGEFNAEILKEGKWRRASYKDTIKVDFGPRFGVRQCTPMHMNEIKSLPEILGLREMGVYIAGFNFLVDNLLMPLIYISYRIKKGMGLRLWGRMLYWGANKLSSKEQGVVFVLECEGSKGGRPLKVRIVAEHDDAYFFTAAPVVACINQYLDGSLNTPGVWLMGNAVDASRLIEDLEKIGIQIRTEIINGE